MARGERFGTGPSSVAERLMVATRVAPLALEGRMRDALWRLDKGLLPASDAVRASRTHSPGGCGH